MQSILKTLGEAVICMSAFALPQAVCCVAVMHRMPMVLVAAFLLSAVNPVKTMRDWSPLGRSGIKQTRVWVSGRLFLPFRTLGFPKTSLGTCKHSVKSATPSTLELLTETCLVDFKTSFCHSLQPGIFPSYFLECCLNKISLLGN